MPSTAATHGRRLVALAFVVAVLASACGPTASPVPTGPTSPGTASCAAAPSVPDDLQGWTPPADAPEVVPLLISNQLACGQNRVLFTVLDPSARPIGAPDRSVSVAFYNLGRDAGAPIATVEGEFVWAIENERGVYVGSVAFPESGRYGAEFQTAAGGTEAQTIRLTFDVQPSSPVVKVGEAAPASKTPTLAEVGGDPAKVSTDTDPLPALYETSIDQALSARRPFVVVFATPKFCQTAQCGPTLDRIKPFVDRYPTVTFINVEPYRLKLVDGTLEADLDANGQLQTAPTTDEWRLVNEPIVFVVDRDGVVQASMDLIFSDRELTAALDAVQ
jgi:hypothetical protein